MDWNPIVLSLQLALVSTAALLVLGTPLARWIGLSSSRTSRVVRALLQIPMVLPPTVLGFYLLVALSPGGWFGGFVRDRLGLELLFHFPGLVIAGILSGIPFLTGPVIAGFQALPPHYREASLCLGRSPWTTFWRLELPLVLPSLVSGSILTFLHAIGEFGVVLMIGGKIPGQTYTVSIQLFDMVEQMDFASAHKLAFGLSAVSFLGLLTLFALQNRKSA